MISSAVLHFSGFPSLLPRQQWHDHRLSFPPGSNTSFLSLASRDSVWTPDTFFRNELEASRHKVMKENAYVRVFPDGRVLMSTRSG